jgi:hypothetical protein
MRPLLLKCIVQPLENLGVLHITLLGKLQEQIRIWPFIENCIDCVRDHVGTDMSKSEQLLERWKQNGQRIISCDFEDIHIIIRVVQSCHLLATYHVTYFTTYLIRRTRRRAISGIMNFIDAYSQAPTYCLCLSGRLFGNPNSGCSPDLFSLTCLLFPCVVVPSLIIASLVFSHTPPLLLGQRIHLLSRWLVQS